MIAKCELRLGFFFKGNLFGDGAAMLGDVMLDNRGGARDAAFQMIRGVNVVMTRRVATIAGSCRPRRLADFLHLRLQLPDVRPKFFEFLAGHEEQYSEIYSETAIASETVTAAVPEVRTLRSNRPVPIISRT